MTRDRDRPQPMIVVLPDREKTERRVRRREQDTSSFAISTHEIVESLPFDGRIERDAILRQDVRHEMDRRIRGTVDSRRAQEWREATRDQHHHAEPEMARDEPHWRGEERTAAA